MKKSARILGILLGMFLPTLFCQAALAAGLPEHLQTPALLHDGSILYVEHCSSCHGASLEGSAGVPNLLHSGGATVDFYLTTGRMPAPVTAANTDPHASIDAQMASGVQMDHLPPALTIQQIAALDAYVTSRSTEPLPIYRPDTRLANLQRGRQIFEDNCQACHGAAAQGATVGVQWTALALDTATNTQIAEAIRIGPGVMPHFSSAQLSDLDIDDLTRYLTYLRETPQTYGGATLDTLGPVAEGAVGAIVGVGSLFVIIYWIGVRAQRRRPIDAFLSEEGIDDHHPSD